MLTPLSNQSLAYCLQQAKDPLLLETVAHDLQPNRQAMHVFTPDYRNTSPGQLTRDLNLSVAVVVD